jgi:hypothetical protein
MQPDFQPVEVGTYLADKALLSLFMSPEIDASGNVSKCPLPLRYVNNQLGRLNVPLRP